MKTAILLLSPQFPVDILARSSLNGHGRNLSVIPKQSNHVSHALDV